MFHQSITFTSIEKPTVVLACGCSKRDIRKPMARQVQIGQRALDVKTIPAFPFLNLRHLSSSTLGISQQSWRQNLNVRYLGASAISITKTTVNDRWSSLQVEAARPNDGGLDFLKRHKRRNAPPTPLLHTARAHRRASAGRRRQGGSRERETSRSICLLPLST